jgi:hypothetical protein
MAGKLTNGDIMKTLSKTLAVFALVMIALAPVAAQTAASFTGKWEGTFIRLRSDGTEDKNGVVFNLTQKGAVLTGTAGPAEQQWEIAKGAVKEGKATFEVQQPNGPLFKFALSIVKERLQGDMTGERDGVVQGQAKVDAAKAK